MTDACYVNKCPTTLCLAVIIIIIIIIINKRCHLMYETVDQLCK